MCKVRVNISALLLFVDVLNYGGILAQKLTQRYTPGSSIVISNKANKCCVSVIARISQVSFRLTILDVM